ncbi:MAG: secretin N-terminal domain-containing protein [Nitrospirae bacterium]|nr:secretin N-terminal domain-containing protein [Nitrospirota bacterium]
MTKQLGCTFRMENGFIRVTRPMLETRSFRIDYISGKRASSSSINASMSTGRTTSTSSGGGSTINLNLSSGTGTSSGTSSSSGQGNVNITTSGTSDFWKELREGLEVIIFGETKGGSDSSGKSTAGKDGKSLVVNELAGIVQVTDLSGNMERIENFLNDIKASVSKQVMIQAHIIEISLNDGFKFGLDWNLLTGSGIGADSELFSFSQSLVPNPQTKVFQIDLSNKKIDALLDAMKEQGQVNVLSSPKISTMNNQRAVMKLTTNEVSWITTTVYDADGNIQQSYTNPQIDEVGLFLDVTPQINDSGIITMQVHPSISEKIDDAVSPAGDNSKPVINIRELDTMISVNNGQTIVIAGLITDKAVETLRKVPILGDIPVLGRLFQQISRDNRKSELVIFLTPYVLTGKSIEDIRNEHEKRLERSEIIPSGTGKDKSEI